MPRGLAKESFSYVARVLLYLYDREAQGVPPSLSEIISETGVPRAVFYNHLKDNLAREGYVVYEKTQERIIIARLTEKGRRLAECLAGCRDVLPL